MCICVLSTNLSHTHTHAPLFSLQQRVSSQALSLIVHICERVIELVAIHSHLCYCSVITSSHHSVCVSVTGEAFVFCVRVVDLGLARLLVFSSHPEK